MRNRTTSASSCGSKWTSEAPSSAAWKMIELTRRTSGTSETPSSTSRSVTSASSSARKSSCSFAIARAPIASAARASLRSSMRMSSREATPRSSERRVASRSSSIAVQVRRVGDRDAEDAVVGRVRDRADPLEDVQRDLLRRLLVDCDEREVDERQLVACREHAGDALARGDTLVDERRGERARLLGAPSREREAIRRHEPRRCEEVGDELDGLAHPEGRRQRLASGGTRFGAAAQRRNGLVLVVHRVGEGARVTIDPSNEVSAAVAGTLGT